jgi:hypothetical protein
LCYGNLNTNSYFGFEVLTAVAMETTILLHLSVATVVALSTYGKWEHRQTFILRNYIGVFCTGRIVESRFFHFVNNNFPPAYKVLCRHCICYKEGVVTNMWNVEILLKTETLVICILDRWEFLWQGHASPVFHCPGCTARILF